MYDFENINFGMELLGCKVVDWETDLFLATQEELDPDRILFTWGEFEGGRSLTGPQLWKLSKKYPEVIYMIIKEDLDEDSPLHEKYADAEAIVQARVEAQLTAEPAATRPMTPKEKLVLEKVMKNNSYTSSESWDGYEITGWDDGKEPKAEYFFYGTSDGGFDCQIAFSEVNLEKDKFFNDPYLVDEDAEEPLLT